MCFVILLKTYLKYIILVVSSKDFTSCLQAYAPFLLKYLELILILKNVIKIEGIRNKPNTTLDYKGVQDAFMGSGPIFRRDTVKSDFKSVGKEIRDKG